MVKSYAQETEGGWLKAQSQAALRNTPHDFNRASDPLYEKRIADQHKSEAERRSEPKPQTYRHSKPTPVLRPESQRGRMRSPTPSPNNIQQEDHTMSNQSNAWLAAHYWRAMNKAKPEQGQARPERIAQRFNENGEAQTTEPSQDRSSPSQSF